MLVLLTAGLGITFSVVTFSLLLNFQRHEATADIDRTARDKALPLEASIIANVEALHEIQSFYQASDNVERDGFRAFVTHELARHPGIQAMEWVPRVPARELAAYEEAARNDGFPEFRVVERDSLNTIAQAEFQEEYFPVFYVEPYEGNEAALGFDLASNPILLEALNKSRDTGQTVATPGMALDRVSGDEFGFLVFTPIYRNGFPNATLAQRRENLKGFALAVFQMNGLLNHSLSLLTVQNGESGLEVKLYDRSAPPEQQLLFSSGHTDSAAIGGGAGQSPSGLSTAKTFKVADRTWELILTSPSPRLSLWSIWQAWAVSAGGLLFTLLLTNYLLASVRRTAAVERLVAARTMELSQSNQWLEEEVGERKRAEEELRRSNDQNRGLLEAIPDMIFRLNQNGEILEYKAAKGVELYPPLETFMGKRIDDVLPEDIAESCISYAREGLQAGDVQAFEYQLLIGEDSRGFEVRAAASGQNEVLLIVRDITERLVVDRMKDEFISVVSHELRTPLTSIRGSLGLMAGGVLGPIPEKAQKMVLIALSNADRLSRLINDILDLERIHSGSVTMDKTECDTAALMGQAAEVMGDIAAEAGVNLSVSHDSLQIWADPDRMIQTFTNLLGNAIKFSPPGGSVSLAARILEDQVLFQVTDQGRGIPAANLANIFERFQQVDASDSREKGGTGLGLAICRSIVLQHGGRIWAESKVGEGSTFNITLPQRQEYPDMPITTNKGDAAAYGC